LQDLAESYKSASETAVSDLSKARNEMVEAKREVGRLREELGLKRAEVAAMKEQVYRQDCETRELKAKVSGFEAAERQVRGEWENTCEDLTKELKYVQGEMT
jgi:hypothetical protein